MRWKLAALVWSGILAFCGAIIVASATGAESLERPASTAPHGRIDFNFQVRPILAENCFRCHGPDAKQRKAELRLDRLDSAVKKGAIKPGDPEGSEAIKRLHAADPDDRMPPLETHRTVTPAQEAVLRRWIAEGARYDKHWAFIPPEKPAIPELQNRQSIIRNPIDTFVQSRLAESGWTPALEASR